MYCKHCGAEVPAEDVNLNNAIAKCRACNAVFSFAEDVGLDEGNVKTPGRGRHRERAEVPMPDKITVENWGGNLKFTRRWFSPVFIFLVFFCVLWDGFLVVWYSMAFGEDGPLIVKVFPIFHVAVGIGLTYFTVAGFVNRTIIEVGGGMLRIQHAPMPWPGNRTINTVDLGQLYCTEHIHRGKHGAVHRSYRLNAALKDGKKFKLLSGLSEPDQVLYLEQEIEKRLLR
ncbi:MAG: hypothetical protein KAV82_03295 [Phycisphaerae bacterium]|nr:hypothetical protein [Phycisphaerae bacterium]